MCFFFSDFFSSDKQNRDSKKIFKHCNDKVSTYPGNYCLSPYFSFMFHFYSHTKQIHHKQDRWVSLSHYFLLWVQESVPNIHRVMWCLMHNTQTINNMMIYPTWSASIRTVFKLNFLSQKLKRSSKLGPSRSITIILCSFSVPYHLKNIKHESIFTTM